MKRMIRLSGRLTLIAFILSLFFHIFFVLYSTLQKKDPLAYDIEKEIVKKKEESDWVHTKARAGNFGAPVMFEDSPEECIKEGISDADNDKKEKEKIKEIFEKKEEKALTFEDKKEESHLVSLVDAPLVVTKPLTRRKSPIKKSVNVSKQVEKQPPLSLAQLTHGFLQHVKNEGNHSIEMYGNKKGIPADEQIKYERYLEKLQWCLQNSFIINRHRLVNGSKTKVLIHMILNKNGSLKDIHMVQSSGYRDIDSFVIFIFKDASTSFPPVPHYLPHDPFAISYTISIKPYDHARIAMY